MHLRTLRILVMGLETAKFDEAKGIICISLRFSKILRWFLASILSSRLFFRNLNPFPHLYTFSRFGSGSMSRSALLVSRHKRSRAETNPPTFNEEAQRRTWRLWLSEHFQPIAECWMRFFPKTPSRRGCCSSFFSDLFRISLKLRRGIVVSSFTSEN